jgi:hypothetical protein
MSSAMEAKNDMLIPVCKSRSDFICDPMPNPLAMVIVDDDRG